MRQRVIELAWNQATKEFIIGLDEKSINMVFQHVNNHEKNLDFSDGANLVLENEVDQCEDDIYSCCGLRKTSLEVNGQKLYCLSCYGH
jgi:hypothetical protein